MGTTAPTAEETVATDWNADGFLPVSFGVEKSRRYHAYMREFYRRCHDWTLALTAISGSAAFVSLIGDNPSTVIAKALTFVVAVATTLDLVFDFSRKADKHDVLCRRFTELAAKIVEWDATEANRRQASAERVRIESDEPTERRLVEIWAHNDECRARGHGADEMVPLTVLQRSPLAYLVRIWG
ncbi:MAG TPA: hypothetical protein VGG29_10955, partial [Caulobacteraceae bacterium]